MLSRRAVLSGGLVALTAGCQTFGGCTVEARVEAHPVDGTNRRMSQSEATEAADDEGLPKDGTDEDVATLQAITDGERAILDAAIDDRHEECVDGGQSDALRALQHRLTGTDERVAITRMVVYDDGRYRLHVDWIEHEF